MEGTIIRTKTSSEMPEETFDLIMDLMKEHREKLGHEQHIYNMNINISIVDKKFTVESISDTFKLDPKD